MKKTLKYLVLIILSFLIFNINFVHATEAENVILENETEMIEDENNTTKESTIDDEHTTLKEENINEKKETINNESTEGIVLEEYEEKQEETISNDETPKEENDSNKTIDQTEIEKAEEKKEETIGVAETTKEEDNSNNETINQTEIEKAEEKKEETISIDETSKEEDNKIIDQVKLEEDEEEPTSHESGEVILAQTVKTIITKVDEEGNHLSGAKLQIKDSTGKVIDEWISDGKEHIVMLPDGVYKLHEVEAPEGYDLAEDKEFTIKIEVFSLNAGVDVDPYPCAHYQDGQGNYGVMLYYVEIEGKKHEVYCINQGLGTPDQNSIYDGEILNTADIRNFTTQEIYVDAHYNSKTKDISDQSLSNKELYDKLLDVIYHRHTAISVFTDLTESEIRYVTEMALKNYTNTGLTEIQRVDIGKEPNNYNKYDSYVTEDGKYTWYLYPMYRSFVYLPDAADGENIFITSLGDGNSFGNLARHWNGGDHNAKGDPAVRQKVARYYELYNYLINDENGDNIPDHPSDMNLYIYSTEMLHKYIYKGVEYIEPYQNLLGVTGYFDNFEPQEEKVQMTNKYSTKKTSIPVKKIWNDNNNQDGKRPENIEVILYADKVEINRVFLNDKNQWSYTFENLDVYSKGKKINYTINEVSVEGYETKINGFTITNNYKVAKRSIPVNKIWEDKEDYCKLRPKYIIVNLLADGEIVQSVKIDSSNGWTYTFENLDVYNKGKEIEYTITEDEVKEYYTEIEGNMNYGFTITNTHFGEGDDNPKTLDNIIIYIMILIVSFTGIVNYSYPYFKNK